MRERVRERERERGRERYREREGALLARQVPSVTGNEKCRLNGFLHAVLSEREGGREGERERGRERETHTDRGRERINALSCVSVNHQTTSWIRTVSVCAGVHVCLCVCVRVCLRRCVCVCEVPEIDRRSPPVP